MTNHVLLRIEHLVATAHRCCMGASYLADSQSREGTHADLEAIARELERVQEELLGPKVRRISQ